MAHQYASGCQARRAWWPPATRLALCQLHPLAVQFTTAACCLGCVVLCHAAAEQEKLKSEMAAALASLDELDTEAGAVLSSKEGLDAKQQEQEAVLAEVTARREQKQNEVGGTCWLKDVCSPSS